jgi:thiol-disulfide isomerase/thioredoxin
MRGAKATTETRRATATTVLAAAALAVASLLSGCAGQGALGAIPDPDWRLRTLAGEEFALGDTRGRPVLVNLWATWCPPCVEELASIDRLAQRVADTGVAFLLVTPEEAAPVREFLARRPLGVPVLLEGTLAPEAFGAIVLPTTFVLDAEGVIRLHHRGAADWDTPEVEALLRALSAEASSSGVSAGASSRGASPPGDRS